MRKSKLKRTMSMLLTVLMVFMSMNFSVFAEELSIPQTEPEITTNELTKTTAEDPSAITSSITEEEQTPAVLSSNAAKGAVADEEALRQAIENAKDGDTIDIDGYIELSSSLVINKAITLHGADMYGTIIAKNTEEWSTSGDKSSASLIVIAGVGNGAVNLENMTVMGAQDFALGNSGLGTAYGHGINVYRSSNVTLKNVFSTANSGAGLIVNGSTVDAQYLMTADNGWYSVNVEKSDTFAGEFTLSSDSVLGDAVQIQSDKGDVTVNASGYSAYKSNADEKTIWSNADPATFLQGKAYIENKASDYTVYDSIQAAVDAVSENGTVYLGAGKFNAEALSITKSMNLVGAGKDSTILTEVGKNNTIDIKYKDGMTVKISDIQMTGSFVAGQEGSYMGIAWGPQSYSETKPSKMPTLSVDNCSFNSIRYALTFFNLKQKVNSDYTAASSYSDFQIKNCSFNGNGVNIYYPEESACYNSTSTVSGNTFDGGVFLGIPLNATIENNTFTNIADGRAAIQFLINKNTTVAKTTIQNNSFISAENAEGYGVELMPYHSKSEGAEVAYTVEKAEELPTIKNNRFLGGTKALKNQVYRSGSKELIYYANNVIDLSENFEAVSLDDQGHAASADIDKKDYGNDYTAPIMTLYPYYLDNSMTQKSGAPVSVEKEGTKTGYATLAEAANAAPENATVTINDNITVDAAAGGAVQVTKPMTITAVEGVKVTTKKAVADDSEYLFNVSGNDVTIKGLDIEVASHAGGGRLDVIYTGGNNTVIENCTVTGLYEGATTDDNHVTGAVMPQTGTTGLKVENCTFSNIYYAGYFQAAGELRNNKMVNTRALLLMQDSNYTVTGNQFEGLTTDIAIVNSGNNTETSAYTDLAKLSKENNNAKVGDYMKNIYAENGSYAVTAARAELFEITKEAMLQAAVNGVPDNAAILAEEGTYSLDAKLNITKPLTLEGVGTVTITKGNADWTSTGDGSDAMLVSIENTNNVTLKNLTVTGAEDITVDGVKKASGSGINVYNSETITLDKVSSTDNAAAGVIVNSSSVTATDLQTSGNAWGGVNVDQKTDKAASFILGGNSSLAEPAPIYSENADQVTVDAKTAEGAPYVATKMGNVTVWSVTSDLTNKVYTLDDNQIATIYGSIEDAVKALQSGGTIYLGENTDNNSFSIGYDVTLPDNITIQGTGDKASVVSLDYNGSNESGSGEKSGTIITGAATKLKNITFEVTKPNRTDSSAAFSVYQPDFTMENCTVNVAGSVNDNYYIFDTNTLPADATVSITDSVFTSEAKAWTVYSGDISKQKTRAGKLTFTGNTITGNFSAVLSQITGAYDISGNTANLTADDACLTDLMAVGSTWTNIQYSSVITNNTLTTQNTHGTDALIRILPIRMGSKVQALPAVMQEGSMPTVSGNIQTAKGGALLPVYNVNMKRVHNNLATLRLQGALGDGAVIYTTYDNTAAQGQPYVVTNAPIMGKTSGGATKLYDNLQTAINEVGNGGTVTIPYTQDGYTYNGNINIRDGVTVEVAKSAETQGTAKINGQVTIDSAKNVTLNNVSVETTTGSATGAIVTKQGASVTINNASVVNKGTEAGTCGIRMEGESDSVTLNGVDITAKYYGVGVRNSKQNLTVKDSKLTGWAAIMTSNGGSQEPIDRDVTITVTNSELYGLHASNASPAEGYATVVLQENFENVTFKAENTLIYAGVGQYASSDNTGLYQYGMDIRPYGNAITLTNCQFQMENAEAKIINAHDNRVSGDNYKEKAEATDANKNSFILDGITLMDKDGNPITPTADQKLIGARVRFGGVKQDVFTLSNTDLTESNIEWTRLDPTGNHIQVSNQEELEWIADQVNSGQDTFADKTIELLNDITLTGEWTPIGKDAALTDHSKAFSGVFDGQKHTISGLTVNTADGFAGLFGAVNGGAAIKNLKIDNANITTAGKNAGVLAGGTTYANQKSLTIENITVSNSNVTALGCAGGIIGWIKDSVKPVSITGCTVENTNILMTNDATGGEGDKAGGIVGQALSSTTISGCFVKGNSAINGFRDIGGIAGYIAAGTEITGCTVEETTSVTANTITPTPTDRKIGVGGIIGTYDGAACKLDNNTVAATLEAGSYNAGDGVVTYKGQYYGAPRSEAAAIACDDANNAEISVYGKTDQAEENGATLKKIVDSFAQTGDTVNLAQTDYTSAEAITISKTLSIKGLGADKALGGDTAIGAAGQKTGVNVNAQLVINNSDTEAMSVNLNGISVVAGTEKNHGVIEIPESSNPVNLSTDNCYLEQLTAGSANNDENSASIVLGASDKGKINIANSYVTLPKTYQRGIDNRGAQTAVNIENSKIYGAAPTIEVPIAYTRGLSVCGTQAQAIVNNSEIDVTDYGIFVNADKPEVTATTSNITGWAALDVHQTATINTTDCNLNGRSYQTSTSNGFGTIVLEWTKNTVINCTGGTITSSAFNSAAFEYLVMLQYKNTSSKTENSIVNIKDAQIAVNGAPKLAAYDYRNKNAWVNITGNSQITFNGNPGYAVMDSNDVIHTAGKNISDAVTEARNDRGEIVSVPASITEINEALNLTSAKGVNFQVNGDLAVNGAYTGNSGQSKLILANGSDITFNSTVKNFTTIDVKDMPEDNPSVVTAGVNETDDNSFVKGNVSLKVALTEDGTQRTWTAEHRTDGFDKGNGSKTNPFTIATPEQLAVLAQKIEAGEKYTSVTEGEKPYADAYYKLTDDITVSSWTPIGKTNAFNGYFDGDGYSVIGDGATTAPFGKIGNNAVIEKLIVKGSFLQMADENAGTVRNSAAIFTNIQTSTLAGTNTGTIENSFINSTKGLTANGAEGGTITNSFYTGAEADLTAHTYTKEDMQKARFAIKLNGKQPIDSDVNGIWGYNIEAAAYPVINKDGAANIVALEDSITVNSSDANVGTATLSHEGLTHIYANDSVTLTAKVTNPAYAFNGWYLGDTKDIANRFSREIEASYQVTGAATITAQFNALPTRKVSALTFQSDRGTVQVGTGATGAASEQDVIYGQTVMIKAAAKAGYKFAYWTTLSDYIANPASPAVANTNAEWTLPLSTESVNYVAMFEPATSHRIIFQNSNGTILTNITVEDGKAAPENTRPGNPTMPQKIFTGWTLNNGKDILTNEQVDEKLKTVSADMTFTAVYKDDPEAAEYTITVNGGTIQGESSTTVQKKYNQSITVIATPQPGKNFAGWHKNAEDGPIVSYDETYNFIVSDTVTLYAVYEDQPVLKLPTVNLDPNVTQVDQGAGYPDLYKLRFVAQINLPDGYTKSACGLVYKKEAVQDPSELTLENVDGTIIKKTTSTTQSATGQWATNFAKLTDNATVYVKAYLTYTNQNGETYTIYSDMVTGTVKAPTQQ